MANSIFQTNLGVLPPVDPRFGQPNTLTQEQKPLALNADGKLPTPETKTQEKYTVEELGARVRLKKNDPTLTKYTDREIGERMLLNKPELQPLIKTDEQMSVAEPKKEGLLKSIGKGILDVALQPARFLERGGKYIGTLGLSPEQKSKVDQYLGSGLQERVGGKEYATPTYETGKQFLGGGIQAAANLATPFALSPARMAVQGAALSGGKALEENKTFGEAGKEAVLGGVLGYGLGKGGEIVGNTIGKGLNTTFKKAIDFIGKSGRNLTDAEFGTIRAVPKIVEEYFNKLSSVGDDIVKQQQARQGIEDSIFDTARDVWTSYAKEAGNKYSSEMASHAANVIDNMPPIAKSDFVNSLVNIAKESGAEINFSKGKIGSTTGATGDTRAVIEKIYNKIKSSSGSKLSVVGDLKWPELDMLRKDIGILYDSVTPNSPEKKILDSFYNDVKNKMMSVSKDPSAVQSTFDSYKQFLDEKAAFKKLTSGKSDPTAIRQGYLELSRALTGQKGTGEMSKAMAAAEMSGKLKPNELAYRLQALDLASKLSKVRNVGTTERMWETGTANALEGKMPTGIVDLAAKGLSWTAKGVADKRFMKNLFKEAGVELSDNNAKIIGKIIANPKTAQILLRIIQSMDNENKPQ